MGLPSDSRELSPESTCKALTVFNNLCPFARSAFEIMPDCSAEILLFTESSVRVYLLYMYGTNAK